MIRAGAAILLLAALSACQGGADDSARPAAARDFPKPFRPVSAVTSNEFSDEDVRDNPGVYPSAEVMAKLYVAEERPRDVQRWLTRDWTRIKSGR